MSDIPTMLLRLLKQIPDGISSLWILGFLPGYLFLYTLAGALVLRFTDGSEISRQIRSFRRRSAIEFLQTSLQRFYRAAALVTIYAVILPPFLYLNLRHDAILTALRSSAEGLCSMVIGLTTIVLTVSVVIILFHKNYYLVFSISDVLDSYHFTPCIGMLLVSCLGTCICALLQLYLDAGMIWCKLVLLLMEWCILNSLVMTAWSFVIIYKVMFSNKKAELRLLSRLWRIFRGGGQPDTMHTDRAKDWDAADVRTNVEYLCAEYVSEARTLRIHRVKRFEYLAGEARTRTWNSVYRKFMKGFIYIVMGVWLLSMITTALLLGNDGTGLLLLNTVLMAAMTLPAAVSLRKHSDRAKLIFDDALGYELETEDGKTRRIPRLKLRPANKYDRFVQKMNSVTAFFCLALAQGMTQEMTQAAICIVMDWLADIKMKHSCLYLPVFASGYYAFAHGQRIEAVRTCYTGLIRRTDETRREHAADKICREHAADEHAADENRRKNSAGDGCREGAPGEIHRKDAVGWPHRKDAAGDGPVRRGAAADAAARETGSAGGDADAADRPLTEIADSVLSKIPVPTSSSEKISGTDQVSFDAMLLGHLTDLTREICPGEDDAETSMKEYIEWLHAPADLAPQA